MKNRSVGGSARSPKRVYNKSPVMTGGKRAQKGGKRAQKKGGRAKDHSPKRRSPYMTGGIINQCLDDEQLESLLADEEQSVQQQWDTYREEQSRKATEEAEMKALKAEDNLQKAQENIASTQTKNEEELYKKQNSIQKDIEKDTEAWQKHRISVKKGIQDLCKLENDIVALEEENNMIGFSNLSEEQTKRKKENSNKLEKLRLEKAKLGNQINRPFKPMTSQSSGCTIC